VLVVLAVGVLLVHLRVTKHHEALRKRNNHREGQNKIRGKKGEAHLRSHEIQKSSSVDQIEENIGKCSATFRFLFTSTFEAQQPLRTKVGDKISVKEVVALFTTDSAKIMKNGRLQSCQHGLLCFLLGLFDFIFVVVLFSLRAMLVIRLAIDWSVEGEKIGGMKRRHGDRRNGRLFFPLTKMRTMDRPLSNKEEKKELVFDKKSNPPNYGNKASERRKASECTSETRRGGRKANTLKRWNGPIGRGAN
jgi:hypothetical protein